MLDLKLCQKNLRLFLNREKSVGGGGDIVFTKVAAMMAVVLPTVAASMVIVLLQSSILDGYRLLQSSSRQKKLRLFGSGAKLGFFPLKSSKNRGVNR